ncbi:MAG: ATP-binding protein [Gammaproteobacteria bacterium]|nr:ATP-binding protein [Gammaproteobacteria bacterium]
MSFSRNKRHSRAHDVLVRLAALLPVRKRIDWGTTLAVYWRTDFWGGGFEAIRKLSDISLDDLLEIDRQKEELVTNTEQFCAGLPANNALLWGARGTGKSSLIQAILNHLHVRGLRLVQVEKSALSDLGQIMAQLHALPFRFLIVFDDLSFDEEDDAYKQLKSALEGSLFTSSTNALIYATSNRRHLVSEYMRDNLTTTQSRGELHESEAVEEKISLSDRFGLWLSFHQFKQDQYLHVVEYWFKKLALDYDVKLNWTRHLRQEALTWALNRGVRSGRTANHFAKYTIGKALLEISQTQQ